MRLRNIPGSREKIAESIYVIKVENPDPDVPGADGGNIRGRWQEIFGNSNPVMIEIGMGKGAFIIENAKRFPKVNFVGIEKYSSVMLRAVEKQEEEKLPNLFFIRMEAEYICNVFAPGEVERIYLNFSDPWPKKRYAKRRLTSRQFLERYERILKEGGIPDETFLELDQERGYRSARTVVRGRHRL